MNSFSALQRLMLLMVATPWAIAMSAAIVVACLAAQVASFLTSCFIFLMTWRWPRENNVVSTVACPEVAALWRKVGALWPEKTAAI